MMINGNHFQFDRKSFFNFGKWKSVSIFKFFIRARTFVEIHHFRALEFVGSPNLPPKNFEFLHPIAGIRRRLVTVVGFQRASDQYDQTLTQYARIWSFVLDSGHLRQNPVVLGQISAKLVGIWPLPPNSGFHRQNLATVAVILPAIDEILSPVVFSLKIFYDKKHFTSKQTEYKTNSSLFHFIQFEFFILVILYALAYTIRSTLIDILI